MFRGHTGGRHGDGHAGEGRAGDGTGGGRGGEQPAPRRGVSSPSPRILTNRTPTTSHNRKRVPTTRSIERRGRGIRGSVLPAGVPAWQSRSDAFDRVAILAFSDIDAAWHKELSKLDIAVDDTPKIRARNPETITWPPEVVADGPVPLSRLVPAGLTQAGEPTRARIVLFRRPLELRARKPRELILLLHDVLVEQVATYLGVDPETIDPTLRD